MPALKLSPRVLRLLTQGGLGRTDPFPAAASMALRRQRRPLAELRREDLLVQGFLQRSRSSRSENKRPLYFCGKREPPADDYFPRRYDPEVALKVK